MPPWLPPLALSLMVAAWLGGALTNRMALHWTVAAIGGALAISQALHAWP